MTRLILGGVTPPAPPKLNRVVELMTRVPFKHYTVRVWSIADDVKLGGDQRVLKALGDIGRPQPSFDEVMEALDALGHEIVSAYEIVNDDGDGVVVYPDWK